MSACIYNLRLGLVLPSVGNEKASMFEKIFTLNMNTDRVRNFHSHKKRIFKLMATALNVWGMFIHNFIFQNL